MGDQELTELQAAIEEVKAAEPQLQRLGIFHGIPLGIGTFDIDFDPRNRFIATMLAAKEQVLKELGQTPAAEEVDEKKGWTLRNSWTTKRAWKGCYRAVFIYHHIDGRIRASIRMISPPELQRLVFLTETVYLRSKTSLEEAEEAAKKELRTLVNDTQWHAYVSADAFAEIGKSGVLYVLRKNRPTIAMRPIPGEGARMLCALCFHPICYYTGSWAGALAPSDEVIAHLLFIRGDEYGFWKKANQIPVDQPNSGL